MHIWFKRKPKVETVITLEISPEEAEALYWAIVPGNTHMSRWLPLGVAAAMSDTAESIEESLLSILRDNGIDPDRHAIEVPRVA